ncbi:MAG: endonuclease/exonuclease/phosphatase family protein [Bacteroidia bacterium]|nr:endonuclease/exonuclease/phosphatase family protein [Bacteroidia bacterium]
MKPAKRSWFSRIPGWLYRVVWLLTWPGLLAPWMEVSWLPVIQFVSPAFVFLFIGHIIALLWVIFLRRPARWLIWILPALLASGWVTTKDIRWADDTTPGKASIRILSYNVGTFAYKSEKIGQIAELIRRENPDVVTLQEFRNHRMNDSTLALEHLAARLGMPYYRFIHLPIHIHGVVMYSRFPITEVDTLYLPREEINSGFLTTVEVPGYGPVGIGNIHLSSYHVGQLFRENESWQERIKAFMGIAGRVLRRQQIKVDQILDKTRRYPYPIVLTGDFNAVPHSRIVSEFNSRFQDSFMAEGSGIGWTYPVLGPLGIRIDYQFCTPEFHVLSHRIIRKRLSDHYPIVVTYTLEPVAKPE